MQVPVRWSLLAAFLFVTSGCGGEDPDEDLRAALDALSQRVEKLETERDPKTPYALSQRIEKLETDRDPKTMWELDALTSEIGELHRRINVHLKEQHGIDTPPPKEPHPMDYPPFKQPHQKDDDDK